jgi:hypothetical protein
VVTKRVFGTGMMRWCWRWTALVLSCCIQKTIQCTGVPRIESDVNAIVVCSEVRCGRQAEMGLAKSTYPLQWPTCEDWRLPIRGRLRGPVWMLGA